jgi:uncharacterized phage-associated protein
MKIPLSKLKAIILYFCQNTDPQKMGKVKLMKLLYFLDFIHTKKYGAPVTFDSYINLEHGPIPSTIKNIVDELSCDSGQSAISDLVTLNVRHLSDGKTQHQITRNRDLKKSDTDLLSGNELMLLEQICKKYFSSNGSEVEKISHDESAWKQTKYLDPIPYELAGMDDDSKFSPEEIKSILALTK